MLALGDRLDAVVRELGAQDRFEVGLQHFALELLRPLLGPVLQLLDLFLHRRDRLLLLQHLQRQLVFHLLPRLLAGLGQHFLDAFLDRQLHFASRIVQFPLLAHHFRLRLLRLGQLLLPILQHLAQLGNRLGLLLQVIAEREPGLAGLLGGYFSPLDFELLGHGRVHGFLLLRQRLLFRLEGVLALGDLAVPLGEALLVLPPGRFDEWRRQRLGELDLGVAGRTGDGGFGGHTLHPFVRQTRSAADDLVSVNHDTQRFSQESRQAL